MHQIFCHFIMFDGYVTQLNKLFDDTNYPKFSEKEEQAIFDLRATYFEEGINIWKGHAGVYSQHGQVQFVKTVDDKIIDYICTVIKLLAFEGYFMIDFHGLNRKKNDLIFTHASQNTSLFLQEKQQCYYIKNTESKKNLLNYFQSMDKNSLIRDWFYSHDIISGYTSSGFVPERLISCVIYFEPSAVQVSEIFKL